MYLSKTAGYHNVYLFFLKVVPFVLWNVGGCRACILSSYTLTSRFLSLSLSVSFSVSLSLSFSSWRTVSPWDAKTRKEARIIDRPTPFLRIYLKSGIRDFLRVAQYHIHLHIYIPKTIITASRIYNCRGTRPLIWISIGYIYTYLQIPFRSYNVVCKFRKFHSAYCVALFSKNLFNKFYIEHN